MVAANTTKGAPGDRPEHYRKAEQLLEAAEIADGEGGGGPTGRSSWPQSTLFSLSPQAQS